MLDEGVRHLFSEDGTHPFNFRETQDRAGGTNCGRLSGSTKTPAPAHKAGLPQSLKTPMPRLRPGRSAQRLPSRLFLGQPFQMSSTTISTRSLGPRWLTSTLAASGIPCCILRCSLVFIVTVGGTCPVLFLRPYRLPRCMICLMVCLADSNASSINTLGSISASPRICTAFAFTLPFKSIGN